MPSNSVFFTVVAVPPLQNVGWEVRVMDYDNFDTPVAVIPEWVSLMVGPELSGPGAGSITIDMDSPFWSTTLANAERAETLRDYEYLLQAWEDGLLRFEWLARIVEERILDDSEQYVVTISGPGTGELPRDDCILRPGFPTPPPTSSTPENAVSSSNSVPAYGWEFPVNWPAMRMWYTLFQACQARGTLAWVKPTFTASADSGGVAWEYVPTVLTQSGHGFRPTPGEDLLEFLNDCTGQDTSKHFATYAEWMMRPGGYLEIRRTIGTDRADEVIFFEGGLRKKHRTRNREEIFNYIVVTDIYGKASIGTDAASIARWRKRVKYHNEQANVTDTARRDAIAGVVIQQNKDEKSSWIIEVPYNEPGRRPFIDYDIGDWIGVASIRPGQTSTVDRYRVMAIAVEVDSDGQATVELTLQSLLDFREKALERELTSIINKIGDGSLPTLPDVNVPGVPNPGDVLTWDGDSWTNLPGGGGGGGGGGGCVFIQATEPAGASVGCFWLQTTPST
jgi:hypothetical protein